jgi:MoaA/NifB/PqqE/SkfB family radical SAM enzyme
VGKYKMITLEPYLEFYITNVCNLSCNGCNRFNNYKFKGHQKWADHAAEYEKWAKRIHAPFITIIGGEPTLNPDLENFAVGIRKLWPGSEVMIQTNGTQSPAKLTKFWKAYKVGTNISLHDPQEASTIRNAWAGKAAIAEAYEFHEAALMNINGQYVLHSSDTVQAFSVCDMKHDHTMYNGKLYKCPSMATIPEFKKQLGIAMSKEDEELLASYRPLSADCTDLELDEFVRNKNMPIKQCKFCPTQITKHIAIPIKSI